MPLYLTRIVLEVALKALNDEPQKYGLGLSEDSVNNLKKEIETQLQVTRPD